MRLIDADALIECIKDELYDKSDYWYRLIADALIKCINDQPTVNAEPVRRGWWILAGRGRLPKSRDLKCPICGNLFRVYDDVTLNGGRGDANFCPNCGARME